MDVNQASNTIFSQGVILTDDLMGFANLDPATLQGSTLQTLQVVSQLTEEVMSYMEVNGTRIP